MSGRDKLMEDWHSSNNTDNVCEYAETALEAYMKKCHALEQEVATLKAEIKQLKWSMVEHD
jgi:uncharacterized protein (UPF0335 family)